MLICLRSPSDFAQNTDVSWPCMRGESWLSVSTLRHTMSDGERSCVYRREIQRRRNILSCAAHLRLSLTCVARHTDRVSRADGRGITAGSASGMLDAFCNGDDLGAHRRERVAAPKLMLDPETRFRDEPASESASRSRSRKVAPRSNPDASMDSPTCRIRGMEPNPCARSRRFARRICSAPARPPRMA